MKILIGKIFNDYSMEKICRDNNFTLNDLSFLKIDAGFHIIVMAPWSKFNYNLRAEVCCCDNEGYPL